MHRISQNIPDALATIYAHAQIFSTAVSFQPVHWLLFVEFEARFTTASTEEAGDGSAGTTMARNIQFEKCL
jgi:hypothetical protein